jgi:Spy/CpxP family protein refolding chaperone
MSHAIRRLAGVALAAAVVLPAIASAQDAPPQAAPAPAAPAAPAKGGFNMGMGMNQLDKVLAKADATPDQKAKIKAIIFDAVMSMGAEAPAVKATMSAFATSLVAPHVDRAALESARVSAVAEFDTFSKVMVKAVGDAAEVLTPEQRAKLAASGKTKTDAQLVRP